MVLTKPVLSPPLMSEDGVMQVQYSSTILNTELNVIHPVLFHCPEFYVYL